MPRCPPHHFVCSNSAARPLQYDYPVIRSSIAHPSHSAVYSRGIDPIACCLYFGSYRLHMPSQLQLYCKPPIE